jgi:hypothetical protein
MKQLHLVILGTRTLAPAYMMSKHPQTVNNYQGILWTLFNFLLGDFLPVLRTKTCLWVCIDILPDILFLYYARAPSTTMTKVHNKPKFVKGRLEK